jgi:hypothetical protein
MRQRFLGLPLVLAIGWAWLGCGSSTDPGRSGTPPVDTTPVEAPQLAAEFQPVLSDAVQAALAASDRGVRAILHVAVRRDGTASAVSVKSADPADLPVARGFAEDVAKSLRSARFHPATRAGKPVDAEFDFTIEADGGQPKDAPH